MLKQLNLRRGDTEYIPIQVLDVNGAPMDAAGIEALFFTVKTRPNVPDDDAVIQKSLDDGITIIEAATGRYLVTIDPADTAIFPSAYRGLHWDVEAVAVGGSVYTLAVGTMDILPDVTFRTI